MKIRAFLSGILLLNIFIFVNSCSKELPVQTVEQNVADNFRLMHVAYYRESHDGSALEVRFYESPEIISLSKSTPKFGAIKMLLDESRDHKTAVSVHLNGRDAGGMTTIDEAKSGSPIGISIYTDIWPHVTDTTAADQLVLRKVISIDELNSIFDYMQAQGCATGTAEIDYCIPFQYVVDGCYARAHKMKQILQEKYNVYCEKVFSYEGATGSLAVDAGDCCVYWWYHVAPLLTVSTLTGPKKFVMDPSMFDHPVTIDEWTSAQENTSCAAWANFGHYEITPGWCYSPGWGAGDYWPDDDYSSTNWTLQAYADLVTCD